MRKTALFRFLKDLRRRIDDLLFDKLEEIFIMADIGVDTVVKFVALLKAETKRLKLESADELKSLIVDKLFDLYLKGEIIDTNIKFNENDLTVILFVGVNGTGKTTSIGKLAHRLQNEGKSVMMKAYGHFPIAPLTNSKSGGEWSGARN